MDFENLSHDELASAGRAFFEEVERRIQLHDHPDSDRLLKRIAVSHALAGDVASTYAAAGVITPDSFGGDK